MPAIKDVLQARREQWLLENGHVTFQQNPNYRPFPGTGTPPAPRRPEGALPPAVEHPPASGGTTSASGDRGQPAGTPPDSPHGVELAGDLALIEGAAPTALDAHPVVVGAAPTVEDEFEPPTPTNGLSDQDPFERGLALLEIVKAQNPTQPVAAAQAAMVLAEGGMILGDNALSSLFDRVLDQDGNPRPAESILSDLKLLAMTKPAPQRERILALIEPREYALVFFATIGEEWGDDQGDEAEHA
jgi:hypothetical protein